MKRGEPRKQSRRFLSWISSDFCASDKRYRFSGHLEWNKVMVEANLHLYAVALMNFAYAYIHNRINEIGEVIIDWIQFTLVKLSNRGTIGYQNSSTSIC
jgi:hypothetical protein